MESSAPTRKTHMPSCVYGIGIGFTLAAVFLAATTATETLLHVAKTQILPIAVAGSIISMLGFRKIPRA